METGNVIDNIPLVSSTSVSTNVSNNVNSNVASGLKRFYHGITYQMHWLMLVALQSLMHTGENFTFQSEVNAAGMFDDVVWSFKDDTSVRHNFLQVKHVKRGKKKIETGDLIQLQKHQTGKNVRPFALQQYFISYCNKIKKNLQYTVIDNLIIGTNIDMHDKLKENFKQIRNNYSSQILSIFNTECRNSSTLKEHPGIWRVDLNSPLFKLIHQSLEETYDLIKIAKILADCVHNNKKFELNNDLQQYGYNLFTNIVNHENGFTDSFIMGKNLTREVQNLRDSFYKEAFEKQRNLSDNNEITDPEVFAKKLASLIAKSKGKTVVIHRKRFIKENIDKLSGYVIIEENGFLVFNSNFWTDDDNHLPHVSFKVFKYSLKNELEHRSVTDLHNYKFDIRSINPETGKKFKACKKHLLTPELFWEYVKDYRKFILSDGSSYFITAENAKPLPPESLDSINRDITEFLEKLVFAFNYDQTILRDYVKKQLAEELQFLPEKKLVDLFEKELSRILELDNKVNISNSDHVKQKFSEIKQWLYRIFLSSPTKKYREMIDKKRIQFKQEAIDELGLHAFLNDLSKQTLKIITSQNEVSCIKLHQFLMNSPKYGNFTDSFLFIKSNNLNSFQDVVLEAFKSDCIDLFILENQPNEVDSLQTFWTRLNHILENECNKKIIIVGEDHKTLYLNSRAGTVQLQNDEKNSLIDLCEESQQHILENSSIIFQGKPVKLSSLPDSRHIFNAEMLCKLIDKVEESVGMKQPCLADLKSIYYLPCKIINEEQLRNSVYRNPKDTFVFKGATKNDICKIVCPSKNNHQRNSRHSPCSIRFQYIQSTENSQKVFKQICCNYLGTNEINATHLIEKEKNSLLWQQTFNSSIYISRKLSCTVVDTDALKQFVENKSSTNDIFIMDNKKKTQFNISTLETVLSHVDGVSTNEMETNIIGKKYILTREHCENNEYFFNSICSTDALQGFNVHWLQERSGKLLWRRTRGQLIHLRDLISKTDQYIINENEFREIVNSEKNIVIAGEPGEGKTTSSFHMVKAFGETEWIMKLSLVNIQDHLENYSFTDQIDSIVKLLLFYNTAKSSHFEETMLKNRIKHEGYISIIFDGFDEITSENQKKVIHILSLLKDTKSKLIITTRFNVKDKLENSLNVFCYSFKPFSEDDQRDFLQVFWNATMKFSTSQERNKDLLSKQVHNFQNNLLTPYGNDLFRNPFLLKLIAEIYQPEIEQKCSFQNVNTERNLTKLYIYDKIVRRRYENYFNEKLAEPNNSAYTREKTIQSFNMDHQYLAFHNLYSNCKEAKDLFNILKVTLPDDLEELKLVGLIQSSSSSDSFYFIHQTFAEYFVACFFTYLLQQERSNTNHELIELFLLKELFRYRNKEMCDFLENMIQQNGNINLQSKMDFFKTCDLLQVVRSENILTVSDKSSTKRTPIIDDLSLLEVLEKVKSHVVWISQDSYYYNNDIELKDVSSLVQSFLYESDLNKLEETFVFFLKINKPSFSLLWKLNNYMEYNMQKVVLHFLIECEKQNHKMDQNTLYSCAQFINNHINDPTLSSDKIAGMLLSLKNTKEYSKKNTKFLQFLTKLYKDQDLQWLEKKGILINMYFMTLTPEISKIYISQLHNCSGLEKWRYAKNILELLLMPILDLLKENYFHKFDELAIISMLTQFIDFSTKSRTPVIISISPDQLHTAINLIENVVEKKSKNLHALTTCSDFFITLKRAGIMTILANHNLLLLDPATEFQYSFSKWEEKITRVIKWRLQNLIKRGLQYDEVVWEIVFPKRKLKRSLSVNNEQDPKRFKSEF